MSSEQRFTQISVLLLIMPVLAPLFRREKERVNQSPRSTKDFQVGVGAQMSSSSLQLVVFQKAQRKVGTLAAQEEHRFQTGPECD